MAVTSSTGRARPTFPTLTFRPDIEALRGIAVLAVLVFHVSPAALPGGFRGVDVFFVLSGFLITAIIRDEMAEGRFSLFRFLGRRARRILPMVTTVLLAGLALGWLVLFPDEYAQLGRHAGLASVFFLNFGLIGELGYFDVEAHYKPLLHLWTLSVEEQWYLVWPAALFAVTALAERWRLAFALAVTGASTGAFFALNTLSPDVAFFSSFTRLWQLAAGAALALAPVGANASRAWLGWTGVVAVALSILLPDAARTTGAFLAVFGALAILSGGVTLARWGGLRELGKISYSLYLWHWLLISFVTIYAGGRPGLTLLLGAVAVSLALSFATYFTVERLRHGGTAVTLGAIAAALGAGILGWLIAANGGMEDRTHLSTQSRHLQSFERTAAVDAACDAYAAELIDEDVRAFGYCRAEIAGGRPKLVVLGDSHAHAAWPGLADLADRRGMDAVLLASSSCPPLPGFAFNQARTPETHCDIQIRQRFDIMERDDSIQHVVLLTRGPTYMHGEAERPFTEDTIRTAETLNPNDRDMEDFRAGLRSLLEHLDTQEHIERVIVVPENPELDFQPKDTVPRPFDMWGLSLGEASVPRELHELRMGAYQMALRDAAESSDKAVYADTDPLFCGRRRCRAFMDGEYIYADDDHLSVEGSGRLAAHIEAAIFD